MADLPSAGLATVAPPSLVGDIRERFGTLCVVGLGYVGLPSAVFFAEAGFTVVGADVKQEAVDEIQRGGTHLPDLGMDARVAKLVAGGSLRATTDLEAAVRACDAIFIMVPTPLKGGNEPDLSHVVAAGNAIGNALRPGQLVILESTVYPGVTEDVLRPCLEARGLRAGRDFSLAYCPERYNPGDSDHTISKTRRIVGGLDVASARDAAALYATITKAGVVVLSDIRTCEAAKVIENTQRDLNIALMNEFALIMESLGLDVKEVLEAAATKWNFVPFQPGPGVGGHCLPKDPFLLVKTAEKAGYNAQIITAGRRINDAMPAHVFDLVARGVIGRGKDLRGAKVVVIGLSYKPNVGDTRASPSLDLTRLLADAGAHVITLDPFIAPAEAKARFFSARHEAAYEQLPEGIDVVVLMVPHAVLMPLPWASLAVKAGLASVFVDGPRAAAPSDAERHGFTYLGVGAGRHNRRTWATG